MLRRMVMTAVAVLLTATTLLGQSLQRKESAKKEVEPVFSGPQVGEKLPAFQFQLMFAEDGAKTLDPVKTAAGKPVVLIFVHQATRPGIAAVRLVTKYLGQRKEDGISGAVIFLADDATAKATWMRRARGALPKEVPLGISSDGIEGPGVYGLNRKVSVTLLVGNKGKVTANFALVQPSVQADVPRVLAAVVKQIGGKPPTLAQLGVQPRRGNRRRGLPPEIAGMVRQLIQKTAKPADVEATARKLEAAFAKNRRIAVQVGQIGRRIITAGKLQMYGTPPARACLTRWADKYAPAGKQPRKKAQRKGRKKDRTGSKKKPERKLDKKRKTGAEPQARNRQDG